jgi:hypothetical protein
MDKMERARTGEQRKKSGAAKSGDTTKAELEARLKPKMVELGHQRRGLILLARLIRNCDQEKLEQKSVLVEKLLRLWSAHAHAVLVLLSEIVNGAASDSVVDEKGHPKLTKRDLETITNLLKFIVAAFEAGEVARNLTSESLRRPIENVATNLTEREGTRFFAAAAYAEGWDENGITLAREVFKGLKSNVLRHAALQKMLQDYKFQRYRTASVGSFRELIVEAEAALQAMNNTERSRRFADLIQQAKNDVGQ